MLHASCLTLEAPNSDQHQISCNMNAYLAPEVMRIKDMITQGKFYFLITSPQYFYNKAMG